MRIGVDFDNTIASYDNLFFEIASKKGFLPKGWKGNKTRVFKMCSRPIIFYK